MLSLWLCFLLYSILFLISQTSYHTYKIISSYELARPIMGTIFLVRIKIARTIIIGERAKRASFRSVQLRIADIYIYYIYIVRTLARSQLGMCSFYGRASFSCTYLYYLFVIFLWPGLLHSFSLTESFNCIYLHLC